MAIDGYTKHCKLCLQALLTDEQEICIGCWEANTPDGRAALPTPTDASGLVEALVKIRRKVAGNKYKWIGHKCDAQVACDAADQIALHALAQHSEGKQWSDEVPEFLQPVELWEAELFYDINEDYVIRWTAGNKHRYFGPLQPPADKEG